MPEIQTITPSEAGIIHSIGLAHLMTFVNTPPSVFTLGARIQATTMLQVTELMADDTHVGFYFYSGFKVNNKGGVLVTYLESRKGKAKDATVVFRHPELVVYDVVGWGSIAISTKVNTQIASILDEQ